MNKQRKRIVPNVVRGGTAIPIGDNLFYMQGRKHEQGGIDIGDNAKTGLEVEGGEVVQTSPKSIKVFSSVPFLYGGSPANLVMSGVDPNKVFNAQERFKDINKINDDGSMKQYKDGGLSRSKDYDSSKKPYPSVKSENFAGGNRSYPIPTKADAIDALRLAGLHGRSDVKAKVYRKYPELRKRKDLGGDFLSRGYGSYYDIGNKGFQRYIGKIPEGVLQTTPLEGSNFSLRFKPIGINIPELPTINYKSTNSNINTNDTNNSRNTENRFGLVKLDNNIYLPTKVTNNKENIIKLKSLIDSNKNNSNIDLSDDNLNNNKNNKNNKNKKFNTNIAYSILDSVGSLIDIGGNIASNILNRNMLNDLEYVDAPIPLLPTKLKTRININPQLQRLYSDLAQMENAVNNNTTSSRTALARNQRLRNQVIQASNELYGNKENIETQLINRDRLNQQAVAAKNLKDYNQWRRGKAEFDNSIREALAENNVALTQGIGQSLNNLIQNLQQRNTEAKNLAYLSMSNPYAVDALTSIDFRDLYRMFGGFRCGGKKKVNRR